VVAEHGASLRLPSALRLIGQIGGDYPVDGCFPSRCDDPMPRVARGCRTSIA
jgi:hypothetical protein